MNSTPSKKLKGSNTEELTITELDLGSTNQTVIGGSYFIVGGRLLVFDNKHQRLESEKAL